MKENDISIDDIKALYRVIDLVKAFTDKNPIRKRKIDYDGLKKKLYPIISDEKRIEQPESRVFYTILKKLKSIIRREVVPEFYLICGGHGGIIVKDIGFCEFDAPIYALNCLVDKMKLAVKTKMPFNIEIAISCFEWLKNRHPEDFAKFIEIFDQGRFEIINPSYSQPYNLIIGAESNIKQFEIGIRALKQIGLECNNFYASECSLHPQIPQILKGFGIDFCSLRTRLLGMTPTTISGNIDWVGLDDTKIRAISDQSGVFNGEYWHGTFFQELPELLYQAVARPFVKYLLHSSIEDFVMPVPYQEEIWRTSKYSDIFGKFILSSEFFQLIEKNGEFKFGRDSFYLGEYIFVTNELLLNNKKCEIDLITSEILNCVLGAYNEESSDSFFEQAWKRYLLTQAHDSYAVPYIRNGDYSEVQLSAEEFQKLELNPEKISISQLSIKVQKEIQKECNDFIFNSLTKIAKHLGNTSNNKNSNIVNFLVFNPTARLRKNVISIPVHLENPSEMIIEGKNGEIVDFSYQNSTIKFIPEVPSIGYALYSLVRKNNKVSMTSEAFFYDIHISTDNKTLEIMYRETKVFELSFESKTDFHFELKAESQDAVENVSVFHDKTNISGFNLEIIQYRGVNRLEFKLDTNALNRVVVLPEIKVSETLINYPFGMEETKRTQIQTLDFLWLKGIEKGILFMQKNSQKFSIDRESLAIKNHLAGNGGFEFAMAITSTNSLNSPYHHINDYYFKLFGIKVDNIDDSIDRARSFLTIEQPISLVNMWRRTNNSYLRIFNPTNDLSMVNINGSLIKEHLIEVDFNGNEMEVLKKERFNINPWKIQTLKI